MGILSKIFGGGSAEPSREASAAPPPECGHGALVPRWDKAEDMGKSDRVSNYYCESCAGTFTPVEAERIRLSSTGA